MELMGRSITVINTLQGLRAAAKDVPIQPQSVERYLEGKFGEALADVRQAMEELCRAYPPQELARKAYGLYEQFRPEIPEGVKGWGAAGELDLDYLRSLAENKGSGYTYLEVIKRKVTRIVFVVKCYADSVRAFRCG